MKVSTGLSVAMPILAFPSDAEIAKVIGHLVIAHTEVEVMRYTVKTLSGREVDDALSSTSEDRVKELCLRCVMGGYGRVSRPQADPALFERLSHAPTEATVSCG